METLQNSFQETDKKIDVLKREIREKQSMIRTLIESRVAEEIEDRRIMNSEGKAVYLSELFDDKNELIIIHNMGKSCPYCTLWADGFSSVYLHLRNRVPFILLSPDEVPVMNDFSKSRNWSFPCYSAHGSDVIRSMGFSYEKKGGTFYNPGVSALYRKDGKIFRSAKDEFGPGDSYCNVWHFFDLLPKGEADWFPQYSY